MSLLSFMCRRTTSQLLVYPHSFTRVDILKRSAPHHCAFQMYSIARNFTHQNNIYVIWTAALLHLGFSASSSQHLAPSTMTPTKVLKSKRETYPGMPNSMVCLWPCSKFVAISCSGGNLTIDANSQSAVQRVGCLCGRKLARKASGIQVRCHAFSLSKGEREKFIIRQLPVGEKDDYDSENSSRSRK